MDNRPSANTATSIAVTGLTASTWLRLEVTTNCSAATEYSNNSFVYNNSGGILVAQQHFEPNETTAAAAINSGAVNSAAISRTTDGLL